MASPEEWLRTAIEAGAGCPAFPVEAPEKQLPPFVVFSLESEQPVIDATGPIGWIESVFGMDIYADTYAQLCAISSGIRAAVNNFTGTSHGATIGHVSMNDTADVGPVKFEGRSQSTKVREQSYTVQWQE